MAEFVAVCDEADISPGTGKGFEIGRQEVGIFNVNGTFYAMENICPHEGSPIADGPMAGNIVTCPLHGWRADVTSGESLEIPGVKVSTYEVKVEDGKVYIKV